jgi:hypothetical protein
MLQYPAGRKRVFLSSQTETIFVFYLFIIFDLSHDFLPNHDSNAKAHPTQKNLPEKKKEKIISLGLVKLNFSISRFSKVLSLACDDNRLMIFA